MFVVATERHVERLASRNLQAITRHALLERLVSALLGDVTLSTPLESRLALADVLREVRGAEDTDAIDAGLEILREACVEASALEDIARGAGPTAERARTMGSVMRALDARLDRAGLVEGRRRNELLVARISRGEPAMIAKCVGAHELEARWIVTWTCADARVWRALDATLSRVGGHARVELPSFERRLDAERERDPLEVVWDDLAAHLEDPPDQRAIEPVLGDLTLTTALLPSSRDRVEIRSATDARAEAKAAADAIAEALTKGVPIDRIAVGVLRADDAAVHELARTLLEARIPFHAGRSRPESSLLSLVKDALDLANKGLDRARVAALLRSDYLNAAHFTGSAGRQSRRALHDLAATLESTHTEAASDAVTSLERTAGSNGEHPERAALARAVGDLLSSVETSGSRTTHVSRTRTLLEDLGLMPRADDALKSACSSNTMGELAAMDVAAHFADLQAWQALITTLDELERASTHVGADAPVTASTFRRELWRAVDHRLYRSTGARAGAVRLVGLAELAEEDLALLVICDATADAIGAATDASAFVPPSLGNALRALDPLAAPPAHALSAARELASLAWAASRADHVVLCRRTHDDSFAAIAAAPVVEWLRRGGVRAVKFGAAVIADRPWTPRDRALAIVALAPEHANSIAPDAARRAHVEGDREAFHQGGEDLDWPLVGKLDTDFALRAVLDDETGGEARPLGTTSLERFASCAFRGFAQSILGGREEIQAEDTPNRLEEGNLAHDALRAAFDATREDWRERPRDREKIMRVALATVDGLFGDRARGLRRAAMSRIRDEVSQVIEASIDDTAWDFELAERDFGEGSTWPPLVIEDDSTRLSLAGKVDRIDGARDSDAVRVIDYKRRAKPYGVTELGETLLQLPIYARVAARSLGRRDAFGRYILTQAPKSDLPNSWADRWNSLGVTTRGSALDAHLLEIVRSVRRGVLWPKPRHEKDCRTCGSDGICRRPRFAIPREE